MASQQAIISETVAAMKKAMKRTAYESGSDNEIEHYSNRGNKLKRRALFAHQGQLVPPSGPEVYKEEVEYAGQQRYIIHRNAPIVDDEGYEVESDDDDERAQDAVAAAAEFDPYNNVRLEQLLAPLTASTDLPTHPTLSKPFVSKTLTGLADQSCDIMRKENKSLWRIKHLFTRLVGDHTWAPCELMLGSDDVGLFANDHFAPLRGQQNQEVAVAQNASEPGASVAHDETILSKTLDSHERSAVGDQTGDPTTAGTGEGDVSMVDPDETITENPQNTKDGSEPVPQTDDKPEPDAAVAIPNGDGAVPNRVGDSPVVQKPSGENSEHVNGTDNSNEPAPTTNGHSDAHADGPPRTSLPHSGLTAKAMNGSEAMSVVSELLEDIFIHPLYQPPVNAEPDRGGLSVDEANDMRQLVALYVQKQEEVCRGAEKLHEGLLKADRLRKTVLRWSKAEAHCGPNRDMSDGEDWYDKEEWGLTEDLKKGQDEEEEEIGTSTKKTRNRR
ncbi:Transcriptional regulatory protein rxt2 like [Verticillium longisporum]|nr:Transcriptional regulatory protein rxt2 like [Verticillium longisporum]